MVRSKANNAGSVPLLTLLNRKAPNSIQHQQRFV